MPTRKQKEKSLEELRVLFKESNSAIMADFRGLNVAATNKLRKKLRDSGGKFKIAKNTLAIIAAREAGLDDLAQYLDGQVGITFGTGDPARLAKALLDFAKEYKTFEVRGAAVEGRVVGGKAVKELADLPPREVLLARVLGGMQGPLYGLANVLQGTLRSLVFVLEAARKAQAGEQA